MASRSRPVSSWTEKELLDGKPVESLVVILKTKGCSWHRQEGCLMCGYHLDSDPSIRDEELMAQVKTGLEKLEGQKILKMYTSGSFLNDNEISDELRREILGAISGKVDKLLVESRPEFISKDGIDEAKGFMDKLETAIGLESANETVSKKCVNKGFLFDDFVKAARTVKDTGASVRTYLLVKPPFMTEKEAITDAVGSARKAAEYSDVISFNPVNVQKGTLVEKLWRKAEYRPPWLWSVLEVLEGTKGLGPRIVCGPSGGGTSRGAHNCGSCDSSILKAIDEFSIGTRKDFKDINCQCKELWLDTLDLEIAMRTHADVQRILEWS
jgi:radical SAM enzyme (TIGR01210 family)